MTKRPIVLAVAPTGGRGSGSGNPITPDELVKEVTACAEAGATVVHMHARDLQGELTSDTTLLDETAQRIKASCNILFEASTGGLSDMTAEERVRPAKLPVADLGSLNIGSLNFGDAVYANSLPDIRYWIQVMKEARVRPSLEIFDTGHLETALHLIQEGLVDLPCNLCFIFDIAWGMPYHPALLDYLVSRLPERSHWEAIIIGCNDFSTHIAAARAGASILRTGFEDSRTANGGRPARDNAELVKALRTTLEAEGFTIATPEEARRLLL